MYLNYHKFIQSYALNRIQSYILKHQRDSTLRDVHFIYTAITWEK